MEQGKVYLISNMGVRRMNSRLHVGRIIVKNVKNIVAFMFISSDDASIKGYMIGDQCVGDNSFLQTKILGRMAGVEGMETGLILLAITARMNDIVDVVQGKKG